MKILEKHYNLSLYYAPMALAWVLLALYAPSHLLLGLSSQIPWLILLVPLLIKQQTSKHHTPLRWNPIASIRCLLLLMAIQMGHHALMQGLIPYYNPESLPLSLSLPWPLYAGLIFTLLLAKPRSFQFHELMPPKIRHRDNDLIVLQITKISIGFLIPVICLPFILNISQNNLPQPLSHNPWLLVTSLPILIILHKNLVKTPFLRHLLAQGCPTGVIVIAYCIGLIILQNALFEVMSLLLPPFKASAFLSSLSHPWPSSVTEMTGLVSSWSWWVLLALPCSGSIAFYLKHCPKTQQIITLVVSFYFCHTLPEASSASLSISYAVIALMICAVTWLKPTAYTALHQGTYPIGIDIKTRNTARITKNSLFYLTLASTVIMTIGCDFLIWGLAIGLCTLWIFLWLGSNQQAFAGNQDGS